jgi:ABC-type sugar transport system ATPase subunit
VVNRVVGEGHHAIGIRRGWAGLLECNTDSPKSVKFCTMALDPGELVKNLTVGEQQIVEIAKALAMNASILIMDEPSAVLPSADLDRLFGVVKALRADGHGIIYISHRLNEIFDIADRVTVLKDGQTMATKEVSETNSSELVRLMVGREMTDMYPPKDNQPGDVLVRVTDLCVEGTVYNVNLQVRAGEVVGMAGLGGSGRTTVCRALVGLGKIRSGQVSYLGQPAPRSPSAAAAASHPCVFSPAARAQSAGDIFGPAMLATTVDSTVAVAHSVSPELLSLAATKY